MDLTFKFLCNIVFFLQHQPLLSPPDTSTTECHFSFGPATSFFLELLVFALHSSTVAHWTPSDLWGSSSVSYLFAFLCCAWGSCGKNTGGVCHSLLQWTTFCQNFPLWPVRPGWPCTAWLLASLSYASTFTAARSWPTKPPRFDSCLTWELWCEGSRACGLRCSEACVLFLDQGSNPCPLHWQERFYHLYHQGSPLVC